MKQRCVTVNLVVLVGIIFLIPLFFLCNLRLGCDFVLGVLNLRILEREMTVSEIVPFMVFRFSPQFLFNEVFITTYYFLSCYNENIMQNVIIEERSDSYRYI